MADLSTLIRLHKHELDEKRRELKELYDILERIEEQKQLVLDSVEKEKQAVADSEDAVHFTYADFQKKAEMQCEECDQAIEVVEQQIYTARDEMLDIFSEMKRYDMAQQERDRIEEQERRLRETKTLDEIALEGFRRTQTSSA